MMNNGRQTSPWSKDDFEITSCFSKHFDLTMNGIQSQKAPMSLNIKVYRVLVLAAAKGGLPHPSFLLDLINRIAKDDLSFEASRLGGYIEFDFQPTSGNSGFFRWFIEPHTLAAIFMLVNTPQKSRLRSMDDKRLLRIINSEGQRSRGLKPFSSLKQFCKAASFFAMESANIALPSYLISFIKRELNSTSINRSSLNNLWPETAVKNATFELPQSDTKQSESSLELGLPSIANKMFLNRFRDALKVRDCYQKLVSREETLERLEELSQYEHSFARLLILEFITFGIRIKKWKTSSAGTYLSHIASPWLLETHQLLLHEITQEQVTDLFERLVKSAEGNISIAEKAGIIHSFFEFNHTYFGIPLPLPNDLKFEKVKNVRNCFISENNFISFLNTLSSKTDYSNFIAQGLMLSAILMARCGLRVNEVIKLRIADVEPSDDYFIFIRENHFGHNKTYCALRKLPLSILLKPDELDFFKQYYKRRVHDVGKKLNTVLFSQGKDINIPFTHCIFHREISIPLSLVCGESASCHTLRHKAISTLQIVLCSAQLQNVTPYTEHQIERIQQFFGNYSASDMLYEIAAFAGHLNPRTTLETYMHFTDVILFEHLIKPDEKSSKNYWMNLAGISKHLMTRRFKSEYPNNEEVMQLLVELLGGKSAASKLGYHNDTELPALQHSSQRVSFEDCLSALRLFEQDKSLMQVTDLLQIDVNKVSSWLESAVKLTKLCTSKRKPRLFPDASSEKLAPIFPSSKVEYKKAQSVIQRARKVYKECKPNLIWFIKFVLTNAMNSHSYIVINDPETLKKFMGIALKMTIPEDWNIKYDAPENENFSVSHLYKNASPNVNFHYTNNVVKSKKFPSGRVYLHFLVPRDPSQKPTESRRSSNIMKFVCHVMAIMVPEAIPDI